MGIIAWVVLGVLVGALAKAILPGEDPGGIFVTMLLGVVGALLGGWLGSQLLGIERGDFFDITTWVLAIVGSLIVLGIYRLVVGRRAVRD